MMCFGSHLSSLPGPDFSRESYDENLKLAKLWDAKGLLALFSDKHPCGLSCRVLNADKNASTERQIGDRRWINGAEFHTRGTSAFLAFWLSRDLDPLPLQVQACWFSL